MLLAFFIDVKKEDKDIKSDGITYSVDNIPKNLEKITKLSKRDEYKSSFSREYRSIRG